jgi:hypothetical protein
MTMSDAAVAAASSHAEQAVQQPQQREEVQQRQLALLKQIAKLESRLARLAQALRPPAAAAAAASSKTKPKQASAAAAASGSDSAAAQQPLPEDDDSSRWWDSSSYVADTSGVVPRLSALADSLGFTKHRFYRVRASYYDESLEARRDMLGLPSTTHLFKAVVMENTARRAQDETTGRTHLANPRFVAVLTSYTEKLHKESLARALREVHVAVTQRANTEAAATGSAEPPRPFLPNKAFNLRLAEESVAVGLTGYTHNAMTPLGLAASPDELVLLLSDTALRLQGGSVAFGGGEIDVKWRTSVREFVQIMKPMVARVVA